MIKFSVIIPIYKVEKYLHRCINSIINQTLEDIEIILVDDGSPDNCPKICDEYQKKDKRIKVIHKKNGGLSDARNEGLNLATGEYVLFVDSDDYIELKTCAIFSKQIMLNYPDIICGNANKITDNNIITIKHDKEIDKLLLSGKNFLIHELENSSMSRAAWLNLYKRQFLIKNNLYFKVGRLHEDEEFTPRAFLKAKKVVHINFTFYNYCIREDSIMTKANFTKNANDLYKSCYELEKIYDAIEENNKLKCLLKDTLVDLYLDAYQQAKLTALSFNILDKAFLKRNVFSKRNILKVKLISFSKNLYFLINVLQKKIKGRK